MSNEYSNVEKTLQRLRPFILLGVVGALGYGGYTLWGPKDTPSKPETQIQRPNTVRPDSGGGFQDPFGGQKALSLDSVKAVLQGRALRLRGSTSAVIHARSVAEKAAEQGVTVQYFMTGTDKGIKDVKSGAADIAIASHQITDSDLDSVVVGIDQVVLFVNPANPVRSLTAEQVGGIFTGQITNWSEVGGNNAPIELVQRASGGTKAWFEEIFGRVSARATVVPDGTTQMFQRIQSRPNAVGYGTVSQAQSMVAAVPIDGGNSTRELYAVTKKGAPAPISGEFVRFMQDTLK